MTWPKEVPILTCNNMHKGGLNGPRKTHCLIGWCHEVFPGSRVHRVICTLEDVIQHPSIASFNDDSQRPKTELARVWNKAMAKLGYVVGNPEV